MTEGEKGSRGEAGTQLYKRGQKFAAKCAGVCVCVCVCRCMSDFRCTSLQASSQANMNFQEEEKMFVCMHFGFNEHVGEAVRAEKQM